MARRGFDRGTVVTHPLRTKYKPQGESREYEDVILGSNPRLRCELFWDFLGALPRYTMQAPLFSAAGAANAFATTGSSIATVRVPRTGRIKSVRLIQEDALALNDTNYLTFTLVNNGQTGAQATEILLQTNDTHTTKTTGPGIAIAAEAGRSFSLSATDANLRVCAGDLLTFTGTVTGTLGGVLDFPCVVIEIEELPEGLSARTTKTSGVGTGVASVANVAGGEIGCHVVATAEAQVAGIDWADQVIIPATKGPVFSARVKVLETLADQRFVFGLVSAYNATFDSTTVNAWFRIEGADDSIYCEYDDGTNDFNDQDTGVDQTDATYAIYTIDMREADKIRFFVNDELVKTLELTAGSTTGWAASDLLQPCCYLQKDSGADVNSMTIDWIRVSWDR